MNAFRQFVQDNERWFRGRPLNSSRSLEFVEHALGVSIPGDVRWLLAHYGFWHATGISSLDETMANTHAARIHVALPHQFIVLYDHHDGGVILLDTIADLDTGENKVYDVAWESVPDQLATGIVHESYLAYVKDTLARERDVIGEDSVDYDPAAYRDTTQAETCSDGKRSTDC